MAIGIFVGRNSAQTNQYQWFIDSLTKDLLALQNDLDLRVWPNIGNDDAIKFALVWNHPLGILKQFSNLKAINSLGAGVDHIFMDADLPHDVPIARIKDPYMANDIVQYVIAYVLHYIKRLDHWQAKQEQKEWSKIPPFNYADKTIGVMGIGFLGNKAIIALNHLGLKVIGWSNSPKQIENVKIYVGKSEFNTFLSHADILICMLPLTKETKGILNSETFSHLPKGAYLINIGRGNHLVEDDLLKAIDQEQISGAVLDVFCQEPLPSDHLFWKNKFIKVTPHIASVTNTATVAPQIIENYRRILANKPLLNQVDVSKGY